MLNTRHKCLLLNSGGYDSTVLLRYLTMLGYDVWSLTFDYGQPRIEIDFAINNAKNLGISEEKIITQTIPMQWCVDTALDEHKVVGNVGYVPMRNVIFLSYALSIAETNELDTIAIGILGCGTFADNNPLFAEDFRVVTRNLGIELLSPLDQLEKKDVYTLGNTLGVKIEDTWSCNTPRRLEDTGIIRCGICTDCVALKEAIYNKEIIPVEKINFNQ